MSTKGDEAILASRLLQRGVGAFKSEDYCRAIHLFDQALQSLPNQSTTTLQINILDSRAAAKDKLQDFKGGLADAKLVIDLAPACPKGYIRAARLFRKIGRFSASVKMFERAITKLNSDTTKNLHTIELLKTELKQARLEHLSYTTSATSSSGPTKSKHDLCGILPFELFITIVTFLDWSTRFRCMATCQSWRNAILNTPHLWTSLSLTCRNPQLLIPKAKFWLGRLGPDQHLQNLCINACPTWPPSMTHNLLMILISKSSTSTRFPQAGLQSFSFHIGREIHTMGEIQKILSDVVAFVHLNWISLVNLELRLPAYVTCPLTIQAFLGKFPRLKKLKLHGERDQFLLLTQSRDFLRASFPSSITPHSSDDPSQNSLLPQWVPVDSVCADPNSHSLGSELETLFLQCTSFTPSIDGPLKLGSLCSVSLISTLINAIPDDQTQTENSNQYLPMIDFTCLQQLENLELCRVANVQGQWEPVWKMCQQLPKLKRLRLEGLPHFIPHFLELANLPDDWFPQSYVDQPYKIDIGSILPQIECICLSELDSLICYKFLAAFGYQFLQLESLSVVGLSLDSTTEPLLIGAFRHLPPLINLNLSNTQATSEVMNAIKPHRLIHLQLANCTRVTFRSLASLVTHQFSYLDIKGCHLISTREMIEWLAQRVDCLIWKADQPGNHKVVKRLFLD